MASNIKVDKNAIIRKERFRKFHITLTKRQMDILDEAVRVGYVPTKNEFIRVAVMDQIFTFLKYQRFISEYESEFKRNS